MQLLLPTATATSGASGSSNTILILFAVLAVGAMWLMSRRTRKQQKEAADLRNNLDPGDEVMTASGLFGTVVDTQGDVVTLETSPGVTTRWVRAAILKKVEPVAADADQADEADDEADIDEFAVPDDLSSLDDDGSPRPEKDDPKK